MGEIKTYVFRYHTNRGMGVVVVRAYSEMQASQLALDAGAWDTYSIMVISNDTKEGVLIGNDDDF